MGFANDHRDDRSLGDTGAGNGHLGDEYAAGGIPFDAGAIERPGDADVQVTAIGTREDDGERAVVHDPFDVKSAVGIEVQHATADGLSRPHAACAVEANAVRGRRPPFDTWGQLGEDAALNQGTVGAEEIGRASCRERV